MVPSIRDRGTDWGGEQGKGGVDEKNTYRKWDEKGRVGWEVWDREREVHPSSVFPQVFLPSVIFHLQTFFAARGQGGGLFPSTVPPISLALSPQCCYLHPLPVPKQSATASWLPQVRQAHAVTPTGALRPVWGAGLGAWEQWVIPQGFLSAEALLAVVSEAFCSQLQVIIGLMVPLPCCAPPHFLPNSFSLLLFHRMLSVVPNSP